MATPGDSPGTFFTEPMTVKSVLPIFTRSPTFTLNWAIKVGSMTATSAPSCSFWKAPAGSVSNCP
jgi:hypothetical protein